MIPVSSGRPLVYSQGKQREEVRERRKREEERSGEER